MRKSIIVLALTIMGLSAFAQQDPQVSFNMFNHLAVNPGYAGSNDAICVTSINRSQWLGMEGAPQTFLLSAHMPFNLNLGTNTLRNGVGITLMSDQLGFEKNVIANAAYAFRMDVGSGVLGLGIDVGILNKGLDAVWITPDDLKANNTGTTAPSDGAIPESETKTSFDMGFGGFYKTTLNGKDELYVGLSTTHLNQSELKYDVNLKPYLARHYYLSAGYKWELPSNPMFELRPSVFIKNDGATTQLDINALVSYNKKFWGGLSIRDLFQESLDLMVGVTLPMNLKIGLAYDITLSELSNYSNGSVELLLRYCFQVQTVKDRGSYRSARYQY